MTAATRANQTTMRENLATQTRRVLESRGWSLRRAQNRTGVHYSVIQAMTRGKAPSAPTIIRWADGIGESRTYWLGTAGIAYIDEAAIISPELSDETLIGDEASLIEAFRRLTPRDRQMLADLAQRMIAEGHDHD